MSKILLLIAASAVIGIALAVINAYDEPRATPRTSDGYRCETVEQGGVRIPQKAVLMNPNPEVRATPDPRSSATLLQNALFATLYVFDDSDAAYVRVGHSPYDAATLGWISRNDVLLWNSREGLDPVYREDQPMPLWRSVENVRSGAAHQYEHDNGGDKFNRVLRILGRDERSFHVAMVYGKPGDQQSRQVTHAWTAPIDVGFDAKLVYFVTRTSLHDDVSRLQDEWFRMKGDDAADSTLARFLRDDLGIRFGPGIDHENPTMLWIQEKARSLNIPIASYGKTPADIQRDLGNKEGQIETLAAFLRDPSNWDTDGTGWLPAEAAPMGGSAE